MKYNIGIIGCGLIGNKRAKALENIENTTLVAVADTNIETANKLASNYSNCNATDNWNEILTNKDINVVIIATTHNSLAEIAIEAVKNNKHVLLEKPAGRNPEEIQDLINLYKKSNVKIKIGFNHRFHPAMQKALEIIKNEDIGDIMFIRAVYGHGGRPNYDKEWRAKKELAGGGELLDQGAHILDLIRYFTKNEFETAIGFTEKMFWDMEVEDNAFVILKNKKNQVAHFNVSWTQWKNKFTFEIMCKTGQLVINGLGRSYGKETLTFYKMKPEMGPPDKSEFSWDDEDNTWELELRELFNSIKENREPNGNIYDALEVLKIINQLYEKNEAKK